MASNVIPATATASIDIRPVKGIDQKQAAARVVEHVRKQGYFVVDQEPGADVRTSHAKVARITIREGSYNASRTSMDLPVSQLAIRTVESARRPAVKLPTWAAAHHSS